MWVPGHGQLGWHLAELARLEKKDRILCAIAGMAPDIDGLTFLLGPSSYWGLHHTFSHSLFSLPVIAVGIGTFGENRIRTVLFSFLAALAHVVIDIFGSKPVHVLWPIYPDWAPIDSPNPFVIFPVEFITPFVMIGWSIQVFKGRGISILEIFGSQIERMSYAWLKKIHAKTGEIKDQDQGNVT